MLLLRLRRHLRPVIGAVVPAELYQGEIPQPALLQEFFQPSEALYHRGAEAAVVVQLYPGLLLQPDKLLLAPAVAAVLLDHAGHYGISEYTQQHSGSLLFII